MDESILTGVFGRLRRFRVFLLAIGQSRVMAVFWVFVLLVSYLALATPLPLFVVNSYTVNDINVPDRLSSVYRIFYLYMAVIGVIVISFRFVFRAQLNRGFIWADLRIPSELKVCLSVGLAVMVYVGISSLMVLGMIGYIYAGFIYSLLVAEAKLGTLEDCFGMGKIEIESMSGTICLLALNNQGHYASTLAYAAIVAVGSLAMGHVPVEACCWALMIKPSPDPNAENLIRFLNNVPEESSFFVEMSQRAKTDVQNLVNNQRVRNEFRDELSLLEVDMRVISNGIKLQRVTRMRKNALKIQDFIEKLRGDEDEEQGPSR